MKHVKIRQLHLILSIILSFSLTGTALQHVGLNDNNLDYGIDDHSSNAASDNSSNSESLLPVAYPCNAVSCINEITPQTFTTNSLPLIALHPFAAQGSPETSKPGPDVFGFGTGLHNVNRPNELNLNLSQSATGCMDGMSMCCTPILT